MAQFAACFVEARPQVQAIFLLRLLAGVMLVRPPGAAVAPGRLAAVAVVWQLAIFSIYLFDGVMDIAEDRLNGSARPIARGYLSRRFAAAVSACAAAAAVIGALLLGSPCSVLVPAVLLLGFCYCAPPARLKRWSAAAGATVTVAGTATFAASTAVYVPRHVTVPLIVFAAAVSLWMGLVGAIAKDFSDLAGDAAAGRRTIALLRHTRAVHLVAWNALATAAGFLITAVTAAPILIGPGIVMLAGAGAVARAALGTTPAASRSFRRRPYRAFMLTQYLVHAVVIGWGLVSLR